MFSIAPQSAVILRVCRSLCRNNVYNIWHDVIDWIWQSVTVYSEHVLSSQHHDSLTSMMNRWTEDSSVDSSGNLLRVVKELTQQRLLSAEVAAEPASSYFLHQCYLWSLG